MSLQEKQEHFALQIAAFIQLLHFRGYGVTFGEAYRPAWVAEHYSTTGQGIRNSLHCQRLAIDLQIFKDGVWLTNVDDLKDAGAIWESGGPGFRWGGNFTPPDTLHFSFEHNGVS